MPEGPLAAKAGIQPRIYKNHWLIPTGPLPRLLNPEVSEACVLTSKGPETVAVRGAFFCDHANEKESFPKALPSQPSVKCPQMVNLKKWKSGYKIN